MGHLRRRTFVVLVLVGLGAAACSDDDDEGAPVQPDPIVVGTWDGDGAAMTALLEGVLHREGDCVGVLAPDGGGFSPTVWPAGTEWDDGEQAVVVDGVRIRLGDEISIGGGHDPQPPGRDPVETAQARACARPPDGLFVIQSDVERR